MKKKKPGIRGLSANLKEWLMEKIASIDIKRAAILNIPYVIVFYLMDKTACLYRYCIGDSFAERVGVLFLNIQMAFNQDCPFGIRYHTTDF